MRNLDELCQRGSAWHWLLYQTEWWNAASGPIRLDDMQDAHRANLRGWLDARAHAIANLAGWYWADELGRPHGDMATEALERIAEDEWDEIDADPLGWLQGTPFYRRLVELLDGDRVDVCLPARPATAPVPRPTMEV